MVSAVENILNKHSFSSETSIPNLSPFYLQRTNLVQQKLYSKWQLPFSERFSTDREHFAKCAPLRSSGLREMGEKLFGQTFWKVLHFINSSVFLVKHWDACLKDKFSSQAHGVQVVFLSCFVFFTLLAATQTRVMWGRETWWLKNLPWNTCQCLPLCPSEVEGPQRAERAVTSKDYVKSRTFSSKEQK